MMRCSLSYNQPSAVHLCNAVWMKKMQVVIIRKVVAAASVCSKIHSQCKHMITELSLGSIFYLNTLNLKPEIRVYVFSSIQLLWIR